MAREVISVVSGDGQAIVTDVNGNLTVADTTVIFGDFVNGFGSWSDTSPAGVCQHQGGTGAESTTGYINMVANGTTGSIAELERTGVDLSLIDTLTFFYQRTATIAQIFRLIIDGTTEFTDTAPPDNWTQVDVDVTSYNDTHTLTFQNETNEGPGASAEAGVDRIRADKPSRAGKTIADGAGGT